MSDRFTVGVLGASGFIGSRLVEWLVLRDLARVCPIVRSFKSMARLARFDLDVRLADGTDPLALEEALKGCDVLFHCVVGGRDTILKSAEAAYRAAARAGVRRLVYLSSAVVHGHDPAPGTHDDSELVLEQPFEYNVSKVMAEHLLRRLRADGAVEVVTLRPCIVFGPRSQWWTAQVAADLLSGKAYLVDGGAGICNTVYVDNLVQAMWLAATVPQAANQDFLITDAERVTWRDLYGAVAQAVGKDISEVPSLDATTASSYFLRQERMRKIEIVRLIRRVVPRTIGRLLPTQFKQAVRGRIKKVVLGPELPATAFVPDPEIVSLQMCQYQLPIRKAQQVLGYRPSISFAEGCARTGAWLRFALGMEST